MNAANYPRFTGKQHRYLPKHKSKFDVTSEKVVSSPKMGLFHPKIADEPSYVVKTENADILIKI